MLGSEFVVDWIKHCFILKFNNMSADIYAKFSMILRSDILDARNEVLDRCTSIQILTSIGLFGSVFKCCTPHRLYSLAARVSRTACVLSHLPTLRLARPRVVARVLLGDWCAQSAHSHLVAGQLSHKVREAQGTTIHNCVSTTVINSLLLRLKAKNCRKSARLTSRFRPHVSIVVN